LLASTVAVRKNRIGPEELLAGEKGVELVPPKAF